MSYEQDIIAGFSSKLRGERSRPIDWCATHLSTVVRKNGAPKNLGLLTNAHRLYTGPVTCA